MKTKVFTILFSVLAVISVAQTNDTSAYYNTMADNLLQKDGKLTIGGYGQIDYNQPFGSETYNEGKLDVHRLIMLFGYKFNEKTSFVTEIEFEHVKEVYVEQAFLNYSINDYMDFRSGLLLIPMGIINEYHEPVTFNGVERPLIDGSIAPTTWREIGFGLTGNIVPAQLKYQAYIVNGFNSYDDDGGVLKGSNGLRSGRQKGAESYITSPNFTSKIEYYGIRGLNLGLSTYLGSTQSKLYDGINKNDAAAKATADSSVIGVAMLGFDARFQLKGFQAKGQLYYSALTNTDAYNEFTGKDLGSAMVGLYAEVGYNVFRLVPSIESELVPFVRYEKYNTHYNTEVGTPVKDTYNVDALFIGAGWKITPKAALKADLQLKKSKANNEFAKTFNAGVAVMF